MTLKNRNCEFFTAPFLLSNSETANVIIYIPETSALQILIIIIIIIIITSDTSKSKL